MVEQLQEKRRQKQAAAEAQRKANEEAQRKAEEERARKAKLAAEVSLNRSTNPLCMNAALLVLPLPLPWCCFLPRPAASAQPGLRTHLCCLSSVPAQAAAAPLPTSAGDTDGLSWALPERDPHDVAAAGVRVHLSLCIGIACSSLWCVCRARSRVVCVVGLLCEWLLCCAVTWQVSARSGLVRELLTPLCACSLLPQFLEVVEHANKLETLERLARALLDFRRHPAVSAAPGDAAGDAAGNAAASPAGR
jgi:hypothetical protein